MGDQPHVCPRCEGNRRVRNARSGQMEDCPTCVGTGVVWDRQTQQSALPREDADDVRDLTYRR